MVDVAAHRPSIRLVDEPTGRFLDQDSTPLRRAAVSTVSEVIDAFRSKYGINGMDDRGSAVTVVLHTRDPYSRAMYQREGYGCAGAIVLADGRKEEANMAFAPSVVAHEMSHGFVGRYAPTIEYHPSNTPKSKAWIYTAEAISESFADVIGLAAVRDDWKMGGDLVAFGERPFRDAAHPPRRAYQQPDLSPELLNPYDRSTALSNAAARAAQLIGRDAVGHIWVEAVRGGELETQLRKGAALLNRRAKYDAAVVDAPETATRLEGMAATATIEAARRLYGARSMEMHAVSHGWIDAGIDVDGLKCLAE
jgi:Zn-dependent metalloprotease